MKFTTLVLGLLLTVFQGYGQASSIIMSSIGTQEVYEGARITVYFSTLKHFENMSFTSDDMPVFGTLLNDGNGSGRFLFDPTADDIGAYTITLNAENGSLSDAYTFDLNVKSLPNDAVVYYVDPINGDVNNPGTADQPFPGLASVFSNNLASINEHTFFYLRSGYHGILTFQGAHDEPVYVLAERNHTPEAKKISFFLTTNWYVSNLDISPANNNEMSNDRLVNVSGGSKKIVLTNCKIYSIEDASVWATNEAWYAACADGIISSGKDCLYKNNYLKNTWFSVELRQEDCEFSYNIINWFGADAVRALDDNQKLKYNQIKNATVFDYDHPTRPQHDDGIQSWTFNAPVKNMEIIGNQIVDISDPNLPLPTEIMQGIVDFDGFAEDWVVENNLVITHHPHGIALYGAKNCKVTNNTVIRNPLNYFSLSSKPWIRINPRKEDVGGDLSTGNLVRNNIMATYQHENKEPGTQDYNTMGTSYTTFFEDYEGWNFHLAANSLALNTGTFEDAPFIDLEQKLRNVGNVDAGCFERAAALTDREKPSIPTNISTFQASETSIALEWDAASDNIGIAYYEVKIDEQTLKSINPTVFIAGLEPDTEYEISIKGIDYFGNASTAAIYIESTNVLEMLSIFFVAADRHDQLIKSNSKLMWAGMPFHRIGGYFGDKDASAVLPFKLPCLENNREIVSADLKVILNDIINVPDGNVDLYGLNHNPIPCVPATHHWQGVYGTDAAATPIAEGYITPQSSNGLITLEGDEENALGTHLQGLYDSGIGCNWYAFLRLNVGVEEEQDNAYYEINAAENGNSFQIPLLSIITSGPSAVEAVEIENGLTISPNPSNGKRINLKINGFENEPARILIHNAKGQEVFRKNFDVLENIVTLDVSVDLVSGVYFVTVLGQRKYSQRRLVVVK